MSVAVVGHDRVAPQRRGAPRWQRRAAQAANAAATGMAAAMLIDRLIPDKHLTSDNPLLFIGGGIATAAAVQAAQSRCAPVPPSRGRSLALQALGAVAPASAGYLAVSQGGESVAVPSRILLGAAIAVGWHASVRLTRRRTA